MAEYEVAGIAGHKMEVSHGVRRTSGGDWVRGGLRSGDLDGGVVGTRRGDEERGKVGEPAYDTAAALSEPSELSLEQVLADLPTWSAGLSTERGECRSPNLGEPLASQTGGGAYDAAGQGEVFRPQHGLAGACSASLSSLGSPRGLLWQIEGKEGGESTTEQEALWRAVGKKRGAQMVAG